MFPTKQSYIGTQLPVSATTTNKEFIALEGNLSFPVSLHYCIACKSSMCGDLAQPQRSRQRKSVFACFSLYIYSTQMHMCLCVLLRTDTKGRLQRVSFISWRSKGKTDRPSTYSFCLSFSHDCVWLGRSLTFVKLHLPTVQNIIQAGLSFKDSNTV